MGLGAGSNSGASAVAEACAAARWGIVGVLNPDAAFLVLPAHVGEGVMSSSKDGAERGSQGNGGRHRRSARV